MGLRMPLSKVLWGHALTGSVLPNGARAIELTTHLNWHTLVLGGDRPTSSGTVSACCSKAKSHLSSLLLYQNLVQALS